MAGYRKPFLIFPRKLKNKAIFYVQFRLKNGKLTIAKSTGQTSRRAAEAWAYNQLKTNNIVQSSKITVRGRPPVSREALIKGLIYRNLRGIHKLVELEFELLNNPSMAEPLGLSPLKKPPSDERFSEFIRSNPNGYFQITREALVQELINEGVISGRGVGLDSCPIEAFVKENNLKTSIKDRYEKHHLPPGDKDARLGVSIHFPSPFKKKVHYFWGYRNHIINDLDRTAHC